MSRIIRITPMGNVGNQMFQYIFARMLQFRVPGSIVTGYDMPMFSLSRPNIPMFLPVDRIKIRGEHVHDVPALAAWLNRRPDRGLDYGGYGQRVEYLGSPDLAAAFFPSIDVPNVPEFGPGHLVINVRCGEILRATHRDYMPVPISLYEKIVSESKLLPVFMGQIGDDPYSTELRHRFPCAQFLESGGAAHDFELIRRASNVVISVSTFSWMAAWLSRSAQTIHVPVLGFFNPEQRPEINLLPKDDARYRFHEFPSRKWQASAEDMAYALA